MSIFLHIARQNLAVLLLLAAGALSEGLITLRVLAFNGVILGMEMAVALANGMGVVALGVALIPHGVIEMGAFLTAAEMGSGVHGGTSPRRRSYLWLRQ